MEKLKRLEMIDFWRGFALVIIFINHIPLNYMSRLTPSNFNFSDCAEILVFISGISCTLAYKRIFSSYNVMKASIPIIRRVGLLYASHITITVTGLTLIIAAYFLSANDALLTHHDWLEMMISDPAELLISVLTFRRQFAYFDILPLYIFLLLLSPAMLLLGLYNRRLMLLLSFMLYAATRLHMLHFPLNASFFNPLAWQFLYAIGIYVGLALRDNNLAFSRLLYVLSVVFSIMSTLFVTNMAGLLPTLAEDWSKHLDLSKPDLGLVRIFDFLTLGYVIYHTKSISNIRHFPFFDGIARMGRHALAIFCAGTVLSILGQIITELWNTSFIVDITFIVIGILLLHKIAVMLDAKRI